jgi:hypothetical protein
MTPALLRSDSMIRVLRTPLGMEAGVNVVPSTSLSCLVRGWGLLIAFQSISLMTVILFIKLRSVSIAPDR